MRTLKQELSYWFRCARRTLRVNLIIFIHRKVAKNYDCFTVEAQSKNLGCRRSGFSREHACEVV